MTKKEVVEKIRANMAKIKSFGVKKIGIFGSTVRDELGEDSDIDVVVEFEKDRGYMQNFIGLVDFLEELFGRKVDLLTPGGVESIRIRYIREEIKRELEYVEE